MVCDSLDLEPGVLRLKRGRSSGGHNGLKSLYSYLGEEPLFRLFVGIGHPGSREKVVEYVLGRPEGDAALSIQESLSRAADVLEVCIRRSPADAQELANARR